MNFILPKIKELTDPEEIKGYLQRPEEDTSMVLKTVMDVIDGIRKRGDSALEEFIKKYDGFDTSIKEIRVKEDEISSVAARVQEERPELIRALAVSRKNIQEYHSAQLKNGEGQWMIGVGTGREVGQKVTPIGRVGLYIPGGRYAYPSTLLMAAIPAMTAGVKEMAICSPPDKCGKLNDVLLYLCSELGIKEIYRVGGAQAVAAMAYGTATIKKVDKIAGPGNAFVTMAKKMVYGTVGIDSLAGPSDITIISDASSSPELIAMDLLSQAEHDPLSRSILLSSSKEIALQSVEAICNMLDTFQEKKEYNENLEVMQSSVRNFCSVFYCSNIDIIIETADLIAPEHLEIMVKDPEYVIDKIQNAGAVFIGNNTPVAVGDYISGTNHVIPTEGNTRFASPLGVGDFQKRSSICYYSREALEAGKEHIAEISIFERLYAHRDSVLKRFSYEKTGQRTKR